MNLSPFAYSLFSSLATNPSDTNILISPYSIASALSLVLAGATKGSTCEEELKSVLSVNSHEELPQLSKSLIQSSQSQKSVSLTNANGIWSKTLKDSYISLVQDIHNAAARDLPNTYEPVNEYIANKTHGLIENMLTGKVDPLTVAILVNAVHFKGEWTNKFDENATYPAKFTSLDGKLRDAKFMNATRPMKFLTNVDLLNGASIVQLDYGERDQELEKDWRADYAAFFILPNEKGIRGINDVIVSLLEMHRESSQAFDDILQEMNLNSHNKVNLSIPRFKMQYGTKSLVDELRSLGLRSCFDGERVLMEMSDDPLVHLDEVFHKAVMEVTEEGTEAAAASVGIIMTRSMPMPPEKLVFDRPFVMIILHVPTKTPLFLARVDDPELMF
jgi:serpin B